MTEYPDTYYASTVEQDNSRPALSGDRSTDVCIVGAGFSGISTALHLAEQNVKVTVLEANRIGWGATGRNAGQIVNGLHRELGFYRKKFDSKTYSTFRKLQFEGGQVIRRIIDDYNVDCDLGKTTILAALDEKWEANLKERLSDWQQTNEAEAEIVTGARIRKFVNSNRYKAILVDYRGGSLNPLKLVLFPSLKNIAIISGWSGNFLLTVNHTPQVNRLNDSIYYAQGYNAFGITTTHLVGRSIAQAITSNSAEFDAFSKLTHMPIVGGDLLRVPYLLTGAYVYRLRDRLTF